MLSPPLLRTLKRLALLSIGKEHVVISSLELARMLNISQQAASKHLVDLAGEELLIRQLSGRKQKVTISRKGYSLLKGEFESYARIFEDAGSLELQGIVVSGVGEGGYYLSQSEYQEQFFHILGWKPYEGTLNLELDQQAKSVLERTPIQGERTKGFSKDGRTFGGVTLFPGYIGSTPVALVIPDRGGYGRVGEFVSPYHLRRTLKLKDGDMVRVHLVRT
ncbi:MAG TPA: DUF120 domain-containing protein [Euryarchaeota archaeon]|nr:DUF120 domain-containing protein [Euryarchaeota archaeon]